MTQGDIAELRFAVSRLRQCVSALRAQYGEANPVRRLEQDLARLDMDTDDFEQNPPPATVRGPRETIYVPDRRSEEALWITALDEGLGYHSHPRTT
ncbi:hypothetical protein ACWCW7_18440 [Nocardia tengchongensis]